MKYVIKIFSTLLLSVFFVACGSKKETPVTAYKVLDSPPRSLEPAQSPSVPLSETPSLDLEEGLMVTGYLEVPPQHRASVSPYFGGFVKEIRVLPGQKVRRGKVLFTLENPDYLSIQQQYLEAKEQLDYLKADFERQKSLSEDQISSVKDFKKAESDYKVMLARSRSLLEQVKLMGLAASELEAGQLFSSISVKAPISGYITEVNISRGEFADGKNVAVEMVNLDDLHLELDIFEKDVLKVKVGQSITFTIPETGPKSYHGEIMLVSKSIDPETHLSHVHGHLVHEGHEGHEGEELDGLIPGMFVQAEIILD